MMCIEATGQEILQCWNSTGTYTADPRQSNDIPCEVEYGIDFSSICDNDPYYYQLCGAIQCGHDNENQYGYCGNYICVTGPHTSQLLEEEWYTISSQSGIYADRKNCDGVADCNNRADELNCNLGEENFTCPAEVGGRNISMTKI